MAKTAEFHTLLRNYRGIMGNIRINNFWISFDSCFFNYYADDDEIQFNLAGQEGVVTIPSIISYDKVDEEDLTDEEAGMVAAAGSLAHSIKQIIDTPILTEKGELSSESLTVYNEAKNKLEKSYDVI